jgi:uncharacterized membrane protein
MTDRSSDRAPRLAAIDAVRGLAMVVMTLDHSSGAFNRDRLMVDGVAAFTPDMVLEPVQFAVRWVTHMCAPTFVLLAGMSLALSVSRRQQAGMEASRIDRDMLIRGALLVGLDVAWMGWMWRLGLPLQLGVLYAIGMSMIGLIALRRLPAAAVAAIGIAILAGGEAVTAALDPSSTLVAATLAGGAFPSVWFLYPFLPWTGMMLIGWALGVRLVRRGLGVRDWLALAAVAAATFVIVRGIDGYGNAGLHRRDGSWVEWLHVSKYPPSLTYAALELGIAFALLAAFWTRAGSHHLAASGPLAGRSRAPWRPLVVLGQTALFYYCLHAHILKGAARVMGEYRELGLGATAIAWAAVLVALYPACRWYLGVKQRHPHSMLRFL